MPANLPLHPELQSIWDEVKSAGQEALKWTGQKAQEASKAYQDWGAQNRAAMDQATGGVASKVLDATAQVAETPGTDFLPVMPAYTGASAAGKIAADLIANTGREGFTPAMAAGVRKMTDHVAGMFKPADLMPIKDPSHSPLSELWSAHAMARPETEFVNDVPTLWNQWAPPHDIWFNSKPLRKSLDVAYGTDASTMPPKRLMQLMIEHGEEYPMLLHDSALAHETGHHLVGRNLTPAERRYTLGLPENADILNPDLYSADWMSKAADDWENVLNMAKRERIPMPAYLDQYRPDYWPGTIETTYPVGHGQPFQSLAQPFGDELMPDYYTLLALGLDPYKILKNTIPNKELLLRPVRLGNLKRPLGN